jgi:hypothetical protein
MRRGIIQACESEPIFLLTVMSRFCGGCDFDRAFCPMQMEMENSDIVVHRPVLSSIGIEIEPDGAAATAPVPHTFKWMIKVGRRIPAMSAVASFRFPTSEPSCKVKVMQGITIESKHAAVRPREIMSHDSIATARVRDCSKLYGDFKVCGRFAIDTHTFRSIRLAKVRRGERRCALSDIVDCTHVQELAEFTITAETSSQRRVGDADEPFCLGFDVEVQCLGPDKVAARYKRAQHSSVKGENQGVWHDGRNFRSGGRDDVVPREENWQDAVDQGNPLLVPWVEDVEMGKAQASRKSNAVGTAKAHKNILKELERGKYTLTGR